MRFKGVLCALFFILFASSLAFVVFIQTKSFGGLVTKVVSDFSRKKLQTEVKIKSFSISVFPPGLELNRVVIKKKISNVENFEAELGKIGFYISLIEFEERKLTFGEIRIADSDISYIFPKKDEELKEIDQKVIDKVFDLSENSPVRIDTLLIENSRIFANHELLETKRLKIFKKNKSFVTRFHISNIKPSAESDFKLDEVWADIEISKKDINIYRLKAQHDVQTLLLKGKVQNFYKLKNAEAHLVGEAQVHLQSLKSIIPIPAIIDVNAGLTRTNFGLDYVDKKLSGTADVLLQEIRSNIFYADEVQTSIGLTDNKVFINKLSLRYKKQKLDLLSPVEVYNFSTSSYLTKPVHAVVENVSLNNALRILPSLKPLKGELNGKLTFQYRNKDLYFYPVDGFTVRNLGLVVGEEKKPFKVVMISKATLRNSQFAVVNNEFQMSASVELPRSKLEVDGFVNKERVLFNVPDAKVNLEDFGNISNLDIKGAGELSIKVSGPLKETVINIKGQTTGFEVLGYRLGDADKNISVDLGDSIVIIHKVEAKHNRTHLSGTGTVNYGDSEIALGINTNDGNAQDISEILHPIFKDLKFLPEDLDYKAKVDVDIFGKTNLDHLKVRSKVNFSDVTAYGENLNSGEFDISLLNRVLSFRNLDSDKGRGNIQGNFSVGLRDKVLNMDYQWENLDLSSFNFHKKLGLHINSSFSGKISGSGTLNNYILKLENTAFNTRTQNHNFKESLISMNIYPDRLKGKASLLGKVITSDFNVGLRPGVASDLQFRFETNNIKPILVGILGQHVDSEEFSGSIDFEGNTSFQDGFNHLDLTGSLKHLAFHHADFNFNYSSSKPEFVVRDSHIKNWNLNFKDDDLEVKTHGEGTFGKRVSLSHDLRLNAKILEILLAPILSADGIIDGSVKVVGKGTDHSFFVNSKSESLNLSIDQMPIPVNNLRYNFDYGNKRLLINEIFTSLDSGSVSLKGDVYFDNDQPDVNLKFIFDKAEIPILGKSSMNITGEGIILGNNPPYNLGGELLVNRAQIVNEINEFTPKSAGFSQVRFLPRNQESPLGRMFNLNLVVKAEQPVRITNSLMDVALRGEVRLLGNPSLPRGEGRLYSPANSSRIFFKNNEYLIVSADLNFNPKKAISNPDFDVQAATVISTYKVYPKAYGDLGRFNFDLTSEPGLPRSSILSLIAFGYTDEIQTSLKPTEQQSLTQVGVGSFVFDRFKISDILNKQFGLHINLGTVIEQSSTDSLLSGRSQGSDSTQTSGALGRTKSATRIELKKRLDEAVTLSVSSTMGGTIGQRQSMNLNYSFTNKVQAEGVFESRTNEEGMADINYNSIGADIKFRRTFK
jgi:translocation and assembly module TamB